MYIVIWNFQNMEIILTILFSVLSVFIALITLGFIFAAIYVILILKSIHQLFMAIKKEGEKIASDIEQVKEKVKNSGAMFTSFIAYMMSLFQKHKKSRNK